jgi:hypothetical protein
MRSGATRWTHAALSTMERAFQYLEGTEVKYFLVSLPIIGVFLGATVFNRVAPFVFGMPLFFAWTLFNVLLMSAIMFVVYKIDPANAKPRGEQR